MAAMVRLFLSLLAVSAILAQNLPKTLTTDELRETLTTNRDLFLLDVREPKELAELGTLKGYVNIPLGEVEKRLGEIPKDRKLLVYCNRAHRAASAAEILQKGGYTNIVGLAGLNEWRELKYELVYPPKSLSTAELKEALAANSDLFLLDVREPKELAELGTLQGYVNIPLGEVEKRLGEIPRDRKVLVYCNRAIRAAKAAAVLVNNGYTNITGVAGLKEWRELNYELVYPGRN